MNRSFCRYDSCWSVLKIAFALSKPKIVRDGGRLIPQPSVLGEDGLSVAAGMEDAKNSYFIWSGAIEDHIIACWKRPDAWALDRFEALTNVGEFDE